MYLYFFPLDPYLWYHIWASESWNEAQGLQRDRVLLVCLSSGRGGLVVPGLCGPMVLLNQEVMYQFYDLISVSLQHTKEWRCAKTKIAFTFVFYSHSFSKCLKLQPVNQAKIINKCGVGIRWNLWNMSSQYCKVCICPTQRLHLGVEKKNLYIWNFYFKCVSLMVMCFASK